MVTLSIIGNIGQDAEVRSFEGQPVCMFNVCCDCGKDQSVWVSVSSRVHAQSKVVDFLKKGQLVYVQGMMSTRIYMGRDGQYHSGINLYAQDIRLCGAAPKQEQGKEQSQGDKSDIPF